MRSTARFRAAPDEGPPFDNQCSDPHGATVNTTGRPVVVSGDSRLTDAQVERLRDSVADVPICPACVKAGGACGYCLNRVGPKRPRNPMADVTLSGDRDADTTAKHAPLSPEAAKVKARKERREHRKAAKAALEAAVAAIVSPPASSEPPLPARRKARGRRPGVLGFMDAFKRAA